MKTLSDIGNPKLAQRTFQELKELFGAEKENLEEYGPTIDNASGSVVIDGTQFTFSENALRMVGYCQNCAQEDASMPIHCLADIADLRKSFRARKGHRCIEP